MLYNVGDLVVVRSDLQVGINYYMLPDSLDYNTAIPEMVALAGMELPITRIDSGQYVLEGTGYVRWTDEMFSGLAEDDLFVPEDEFKSELEALLCG